MRLVALALFTALSVGVAAPSAIAQQGTQMVPARDFSGVWTDYRAPGVEFVPTLPAGPSEPQPFTEEGARRWAEYEQLQGVTGDGPHAHCVQYGMPTMMETAGVYPIEFIVRPEQVTVIAEIENETRRIYLPGRSIPPEKRLPVRQGYSEGHWEGDTLVVTVTDFSDGFDQRNWPHSEEAVMVERYRMVPDAGVGKILEYEVTLTDPVYYTRPIRIEKRWMPLEDGFIFPYNCSEQYWLALMDARRAQLEAGEPVTARMSDVIDVYE